VVKDEREAGRREWGGGSVKKRGPRSKEVVYILGPKLLEGKKALNRLLLYQSLRSLGSKEENRKFKDFNYHSCSYMRLACRPLIGKEDMVWGRKQKDSRGKADLGLVIRYA